MDPHGFAALARIDAVCRGTHALLRAHADGARPADTAVYLADHTFPYLDAVREGLRSTIRAEALTVSQWRDLFARDQLVLPDDDRAAFIREQLALARLGRDRLRLPETGILAAISHARAVLAAVPHLPPDAVAIAAAPSIGAAGLSAPRSDAELIGRIDELEHGLHGVAAGDGPRPPVLRRTLAYFAAAVTLAL